MLNQRSDKLELLRIAEAVATEILLIKILFLKSQVINIYLKPIQALISKVLQK